MAQSTRSKTPIWKRLLTAAGTLVLTLAVVGASIAAVSFGANFLAKRAEASATDDIAPAIPVSVAALTLEDGFAMRRHFVGQVEAPASVELSFELSGRLDEILADEGTRVAKGQVLARLDTRLLRAEREQLLAARTAASAQRVFADQTLERARALNARGFASTERMDAAVARMRELDAQIAEIDAGLTGLDIRIEKSTLHAPRAGRITERRVDGGETLAPGQSILGLVEDGQPLVRVGLPLSVDPEHLMRARIAVGDRSFAAELERLRPDIDPETRTRTALLRLTDAPELTYGQIARLTLERDIDVQGTWVPVLALKEAGRGTWSVMLVDEEMTARTALVEVVHTDGERVYVRGTFPEGARLISEGPHRVTPGQTVRIANEG